MKRYDTAEDIHMRLHNSIVRYLGRPVLVSHQGGSLGVVVTDLITGKQKSVDPNSDEVDISSPPLGYINTGGKLYYASRSSARRQKQGIPVNELLCHQEPNVLGEGYKGARCDQADIGHCILGEYPSVEAATDYLKRGLVSGMAFDRRMGFHSFKRKTPLFDIRYVCKSIGLYLPSERVAVLPETVSEIEKSATRLLKSHGISVETGKINV